MDTCSAKCINREKVKKTIKAIPPKEDIGLMSDIFKALSDPSRLKIVLVLLNQELCVCEIAAVCHQTDSAVSHQLRILRGLKIVKNRRQGKIVYYSLDDNHVASLINMSLKHVRHQI